MVVEGYFDVIGLAQGGIPGVVGTCGTALTPEQAMQLKRLSDRVVLVFDGDEAGLRAALRALPVLVGPVSDVRVLLPPPGKDPDLWVREDGADAVRAALDRARSPLAFLEDLVTARVLSRREAAGRAADLAALIADPISRDLWVQEAAGRYGVSADAFTQAVRGRLARLPSAAAAPDVIGSGPSSRSRGEPAGRVVDPGGTGADGMGPRGSSRGTDAAVFTDALERECLRTALARPEWASTLATAVGEAGVFASRLGTLLGWIAEAAAESGGRTPGTVLACTIQAHPGATGLTAFGMEIGGDPEEPDALLPRIQLRGLRRRMEELNALIRRSEEDGNRESLDRFLRERQALAAERARLDGLASGRAPAPEDPRKNP